jgi:glycosyltransferase involved in cell wall biosynthesis
MIPTIKIAFKDTYRIINEKDFDPSIHRLYYQPEPYDYPNGKPLVSICCDAYNHAAFIEQTIHGFLIQRTEFPIEIVIMDDASTDGTAAIIKKYTALYPGLFQTILQKENKHKALVDQGCFSGFEPLLDYVFPKARGKYLALCEGDDYWTDPYKLRKQVEAMESHPEAIMSYHPCMILDEKRHITKPYGQNVDFTPEELRGGPLGMATATKMIKNLKRRFDRTKNGDLVFTAFLGQFGSCIFVPNIEPSIYRIHKDGVWSGKKSYQKQIIISKMPQFMQTETFFGIIIPTYHRQDDLTKTYLMRALESVFAQQYQSFHVYIIGDKYEPESELDAIMSRYDSAFCTVVNLSYAKERDQYAQDSTLLWCSGGVNATNFGIDLAIKDSIDYICFLDQDDFWEPNHLQSLNEAIREQKADWVCTLAKTHQGYALPNFDRKGKYIEFLPEPRGCIKASVCYNARKIPLRPRDVHAETGEGCPADADLWRRISDFIKKNKLRSYCVNQITCNYDTGEYTRHGGR